MEHSEAFHNNCVINLCCLCSKRENLSLEKWSSVYLCEKFKYKILVVFGVNISTDEGGKHPIQLCTLCYRRIINSRRNQGGKPQSEFVSSAEKSEFPLIDSKWSAWSDISSYESCFSCKTFCDQKKGDRPKQSRQKGHWWQCFSKSTSNGQWFLYISCSRSFFNPIKTSYHNSRSTLFNPKEKVQVRWCLNSVFSFGQKCIWCQHKRLFTKAIHCFFELRRILLQTN